MCIYLTPGPVVPCVQTKGWLDDFRCFRKIVDGSIRGRPWSINGITSKSTVTAYARHNDPPPLVF